MCGHKKVKISTLNRLMLSIWLSKRKSLMVFSSVPRVNKGSWNPYSEAHGPRGDLRTGSEQLWASEGSPLTCLRKALCVGILLNVP